MGEGGGGGSERVKERLKEKKQRKGNKDRKRGEERNRLAGGLMAECLVVRKEMDVGCFLFYPTGITAVVMETGQNLLDCF